MDYPCLGESELSFDIAPRADAAHGNALIFRNKLPIL